jgi:RNA polymerase sigma factor (sigma-70 family)
MSGNDYGDLIEKWKIKLIALRARRLGFTSDEIPDLQQDIILELLGFEYDATQGASETTAFGRVIDRKLINERRNRNRDIRRINCDAISLNHVDDWACPVSNPIERCELRIDLADAMTGLTETERHVCNALLHGENQASIAEQRGCSRAAVWNIVKRLRNRFRKVRLDACSR